MCMHSSMLYRENNMSAKCVLLLLCYHQLLGGAVSEFTPTVYGIKSTAECGQYNPLHDEQLNQVLWQFQQGLPTHNLSEPQLNQNATLPKHNTSCKSILNCFPSAPSGYYNITTTNSTTTTALVYCDMEGTNCGREEGWRRGRLEERKAGRELHMSTWHNLVRPAHKDWTKAQLVFMVKHVPTSFHLDAQEHCFLCK